MRTDQIIPFRIDIANEGLSDLRQRLQNTRWTYQVEGTNWDAGTDLDYLRELVSYWQDGYDWRKQEAELNRFAHFKTMVDDIGIHFIHERGKGPNPFPLILTHGYPDSFYRFAKIIPMLTDPASYGGRSEDSCDVVVPDQFAPSFLLLDTKHVTGIITRSDGTGAYGGGTYDIVAPLAPPSIIRRSPRRQATPFRYSESDSGQA